MVDILTHRTTDFQEAIYLRKSGILFIRTEWPTPQQAVFIFRKPPDDILVNWQTGQDGGVRVVMDAADFFRDELHRRDR
jgi:hypothetical protein